MAQNVGSNAYRFRTWIKSIAAILPIAMLLFTGSSRAQEHQAGIRSCDDLLIALRPYISTDSAAVPGRSSQCEDGVLQVDLKMPADIRNIDLLQISEIVKDQYRFFGLAGFYGSANIMVLGESGTTFTPVTEGANAAGSWLAVTGRFNVLGIRAPGAILTVSEDRILLEWPPGKNFDIRFLFGEKETVAENESVFESTRYSHLWGWLAAMSRWVEEALEAIHRAFQVSWGWSVFVLAVALKILLLPVAFLTVRLQREVSNYQRKLEPQLRDIKAQYDGEQAHGRIMQAHKELGITPFFTLRPMFGLLIQVPVLIAVFNALGEMPQMINAGFLWIDSLAYPDSVATIPFAIPLLGDTINVLPVLMTMVTLLSTITFTNPLAPNHVVKTQKSQLYVMAAAFFVLFYSFPAAMVWYWTATNGLQLIQQRILKI